MASANPLRRRNKLKIDYSLETDKELNTVRFEGDRLILPECQHA